MRRFVDLEFNDWDEEDIMHFGDYLCLLAIQALFVIFEVGV